MVYNKQLFFLIVWLFAFIINTLAQQQPSRQELEQQRKKIKAEIEQTQKLINENQKNTKQNLTTLNLIANKVNLQNKVVQTLDRDVQILDNNIYTIQKDINAYNKVLDTLKQEYAKSMVYAYKNRNNSQFFSFILSSKNFNDAFKRVNYLRSYRDYRDMQGANIKRMQTLRYNRLKELGVVKEDKNATLSKKTAEVKELEAQKTEQSVLVAKLQKEGNTYKKNLNAKKAQMQKINATVNAIIKKELALEKKKAEEERKRNAAIAKAAAEKNKPAATTVITAATKTEAEIKKKEKAAAPIVYKEFDTETSNLNTKFEGNRGLLPWPVDGGQVILNYGPNKLPDGRNTMVQEAITIASPIGSAVKSVFPGTVSLVDNDNGIYSVMIKHGTYYTTYGNLGSTNVKAGQTVSAGQVIGKVAANLDGNGAMDFYIRKGLNTVNPVTWLRRN